MSDGLVAWVELTTERGDETGRFYQEVLGVPVEPFDMGGYADHNVGQPPGFGICHPRSSDDALPPGWMVYLRVADLEAALEKARRLGAEVLKPPHATKGYGVHAVIRDPAGNTTALFQPE